MWKDPQKPKLSLSLRAFQRVLLIINYKNKQKTKKPDKKNAKIGLVCAIFKQKTRKSHKKEAFNS